MKKLAVFLLMLLPGTAFAVSVTGVSGTVSTGNSITISGSGFGTKSPVKPVAWADFETDGNPVASLSLDSTWATTQNLTRTASVGFGGTYGMQGTAGGSPWTLRLDSTSPYWTAPGQHTYVSRRTKKNFQITDPSQNYKIVREWAHGEVADPDLYAASNNGRLFTEGVANPPDPGCFTDIHGWNVDTTNWAHEEIYQTGSTSGTKNGVFTYRVDGVDKTSCSIITSDSTAPNYMEEFYVEHEVPANTNTWSPAWSSSNNVWVDEVYADTSWAHAVIGNASTWSACTDFNNLIPSAWADGSITAVVGATTAFSNGATAYVYVWKEDGTFNSTGYAVTIGSGSGNPAPTLSSVSPNSCNTNGAVTITATGTGFLTGMTATINGNTCTSPNVASSTSFTCVAPAGTVGSTTFVVQNTDTQTASIAFTYTAIPTLVFPSAVCPCR